MGSPSRTRTLRAIFGINNSNAQGYTFQNNIITGNAVGMNIHTVGPEVTLIRQNRFVANTKVPGTNPNSGTSIFVTNGHVAGMMIEDNLFQGNVGTSAADINTPGGAIPSSGITVRNNTSIDDSTFFVVNNTTGTQIANNTITHTDPLGASGSAILLFNANPAAIISGNTIDGGAAAGIGDFSGSALSGNPTIADNTISNRTVAVRLSQPGATVSANTITNSSQFGVWMQPTATGGTVTGNTITSTVGVDCQDDSTGSGTAGTANTWTANIGTTSSPVGLCSPPPPPTTTTTTTTIAAATTTTTTPATTTTTGVTTTTAAAVSPTSPTTTTVRPPSPAPRPPSSGQLPATGSPTPLRLLPLGLVLLGAGIVLIRLGRSPRDGARP